MLHFQDFSSFLSLLISNPFLPLSVVSIIYMYIKCFTHTYIHTQTTFSPTVVIRCIQYYSTNIH